MLVHVLSYLLTIVFLPVGLCAAETVAIQGVLQQVLGLTPPPENVPRRYHQPPRHMLQLYERFAGRQHSTSGVDTVTSIIPNIDSDMLLFNISTICTNGGESIRSASLHLRRRPRRRRHSSTSSNNSPSTSITSAGVWSARRLAPPARVRLYRMNVNAAPRRAVALASLPVPHTTRGGWHTLDVGAVVKELCATVPARGTRFGNGLDQIQKPKPSKPAKSSIALSIRFEAPRGRVLSPDNFLDRKDDDTSSPAFLVVFADEGLTGLRDFNLQPSHIEAISELLKEDETNATESKHRHHQGKKNKQKIKEPEIRFVEKDGGDINELISMQNVYSIKHKFGKNKLKKPYANYAYNSEEEIERNVLLPRKLKRGQRSIEDNELPEHFLGYEDRMKYKYEHEDGRDSDNDMNYDVSNTDKDEKWEAEVKIDTEENVTEDYEMNTIPYPKSDRRRNKGRGRKGRRRHKKRGQKIPDGWQYRKNVSEDASSVNKTKESAGVCRRKKLVVNFASIGWSDWIISPLSFEAHYCAGSCPFPLTKTLKPTNHATIQSLVRAFGGGVPAPCCVPDSLSPVTLLYTDIAGNVVLRNYPDMSVTSCACR